MTKKEFIEFYEKVVKPIAIRFENDYDDFTFCNNYSALYEEYLNQKTMLRFLYDKDRRPEKTLLDRHKVCACMLVAIIKVRLLSSKIESDEGFELSNASKINEQLGFMCTWELFKGFIRLKEEKLGCKLPDTYHNPSFIDTITRSLFMANQLNSLSTPLIANIFFLLEKYCEKK